MDFQIRPLKGVGTFDFGLRPDEVQRQLRQYEPVSGKRSDSDAYPFDYFRELGVFFYYDAHGHLDAVEFAPPAKPNVNGLLMLGRSFGEVVGDLSAADNSVRTTVDSAIAHRLGVSIWVPFAKDDPDAPVESVLAFREGYYK